MLKAVHKLTGKIVWAFALENDATWIGKDQDEFIAPRYMVYDFQENGDIKVFFTKSHSRDGLPVRCHFKHESNRDIYDKESESQEHKMAKEGIYEAICNGDIKIEGISINSLCKDIQFEYPTSNSKKSKIADVIAIFKEWNPIYGKGIIFEVQFSGQIDEITDDRTFNRVTEGYSVCWLWESNFTKDCKLKINREINIIPFSKALEEYQKKIEGEKISQINSAGLILDKKILELQTKYNSFQEDLANKSNEVIDTMLSGFRYKLEEITSATKIRIDSVKDIIKNEKEQDISYLIKQSNEEILNEYKNQIKSGIIWNFKIKEIQQKITDEVANIGLNQLKTILKQEVNESIKDYIKNINLKPILEELMSSKISSITLPEIVQSIQCKNCLKNFPVKAVEYENGWAYCQDCFNSLESNWQKRKIKDCYKTDGQNKIN